ncbi:MAG: hypothetical protein QCI38_02110, partial [Candidatus Thermoplasmatota archaeon]|nr:hypothetical protein [Candidatus Thermoplasmatota archaeon]
VFNGHDHTFRHLELDGVKYYTTGGGGASLYSSSDLQGYNHYLRVVVKEDGVDLDVQKLSPPLFDPASLLSVETLQGRITLSLEEVMAMPDAQGMSSFQNRFENWRGPNHYRGVAFSSLVEMAGGLSPGDILEITASDGYSVQIGYRNVYPDEEWLEIQGTIMLAYESDGDVVPQWSDGLRLVALPPDGNYSNQDALDTTSEGITPPASAGERCIRNVISIRVVQYP